MEKCALKIKSAIREQVYKVAAHIAESVHVWNAFPVVNLARHSKDLKQSKCLCHNQEESNILVNAFIW